MPATRREAELARPAQRQYGVVSRCQLTIRPNSVDCHWPDKRRIVELDGWEGHSTRTAIREDRARDRRLAAAG